MKTKAVFYHAGCPVCVSAEATIAKNLDPHTIEIEIVHLGKDRTRIAQAEKEGVRSAPALVIDGQVCHINFGAALKDL